MKILFVCDYYKPAYVYGGPVPCMASLCEGLTQVGAEICVFTTDANGPASLHVPLEQPVDVDGVPVWYFPRHRRGLSWFYSPSLARASRDRIREFDLVVVASVWGHGLPAAARPCMQYDLPYVITIHGQLLPWALANKGLKKELYLQLFGRRYIDRAAAIHCTAPVEAEQVAMLGFRPPLFVVPYGLYARSFGHATERQSLKEQLGIPKDAEVLLLLGRLVRIKRPDIAVDTLVALQSLARDIHLVCIGPDEEGLMSQLKGKAQNLSCADRVHFTGLLNKSQVAAALQEATLLLMPSEVQENFGMSALEAMASGVPILVSEGVPVGKWAQVAQAGRVVPCTTEAFQQAALELLSMPDQLKQMGKHGMDLAQQRFDVPVVAREMLAHYQSIVAAGVPLAETAEIPVSPERARTGDYRARAGKL